jgi:hypothetical protein
MEMNRMVGQMVVYPIFRVKTTNWEGDTYHVCKWPGIKPGTLINDFGARRYDTNFDGSSWST